MVKAAAFSPKIILFLKGPDLSLILNVCTRCQPRQLFFSDRRPAVVAVVKMNREDIKDRKYHRDLRSQIVEMPGAYFWKTLAAFCSRRNPLRSSRHVLDDTSGRSSEVDGKGLQRSRFGKDDTLHEARYSKCRLRLKCQSGFSSLFPFRSEIKAKHLPATFLQVKKTLVAAEVKRETKSCWSVQRESLETEVF